MLIKELNIYIVELDESEEYSDNMVADGLATFNWTLLQCVVKVYLRRCMLISLIQHMKY